MPNLRHGFDEKSDFLNCEFLIWLPAITQFKMAKFKRTVESRDVTSSSQDIKTNVAT